MIIKSMVVGPIQANCYLLCCPETKEALVIDPGDEPARIAGELSAAGCKPVAYLLTHGHLDHVGAASPLRTRLGGEILLHDADQFLYEAAPEHARGYGLSIPPVLPVDRFIAEGEEVAWGRAVGQVIATPGHSPGGICLRVAGGLMAAAGRGTGAADWVFTGDTLFMGSIGRTDLPGGSYEELMNSIRTRLLCLPDQTVIASGHGPLTTIEQEKRINPFVQELL